METQLGEATGDGSDDALVFEGTGGSGACGTTLLLDDGKLVLRVLSVAPERVETRVEVGGRRR